MGKSKINKSVIPLNNHIFQGVPLQARVAHIMIQKTINSFSWAWNGIKTVWREERNFRIEIVVAIIVVFFVYYFQFKFDESVFCIISIVMVLSAEILNTAIEDISNKIEPNHDPIIGKIKDIMAGFVLVTVIGAIIIALFVIYHHFL
jgi:diacylglycerol kinase